jgi:hypothetical protein
VLLITIHRKGFQASLKEFQMEEAAKVKAKQVEATSQALRLFKFGQPLWHTTRGIGIVDFVHMDGDKPRFAVSYRDGKTCHYSVEHMLTKMRRLKLDLIRADPLENFRRSRMAMLTLICKFLGQATTSSSSSSSAAERSSAEQAAMPLDVVGEELLQKLQRMIDTLSSLGQLGQASTASPSFSAEQVRRAQATVRQSVHHVHTHALTCARALVEPLQPHLCGRSRRSARWYSPRSSRFNPRSNRGVAEGCVHSRRGQQPATLE